MKRFLIILLSALLCLAPMGALAEAENDNVLVVFYLTNPESLDPQMTTEDYSVPLNIFDRLVECITVDGEATIVPGLAKEWTVSEDGLNWTFTLEQGVKFHNGEEFTSDDVVFTINRMMNPESLAKNTDCYDMIAGAKAFYNGEADSVAGVKAIDDYTVEITLENAYAPFLANLATPGCSILNREATELAGDQFGVDPAVTVGSGPFIAKTWELSSEMFLAGNADYFKGAPQIDGVRYLIVPDADTQRMLFETGQADVFDFNYAQSQLEYFKQSEWADNLVSGRRANLYFYLFNQTIEPLGDVKVRQALQMAIDRQPILDALFNGEGTVFNSFVPPGVKGHNPDAPEIKYDPEAAKALLAEAGYPNGFELEIIQVADNPAILAMNEVFQYYMSEIGVTVNITQTDSATYSAMRAEGKLPSYRSTWGADFNDPDNFLYTFFSEKNSVMRGSNYANAEVHQMLEEARHITDDAARMEMYQKAEQIIVHEDYACIPLFQENHVFCLSDRVEGFQVSWNGWSDMMYYTISLRSA